MPTATIEAVQTEDTLVTRRVGERVQVSALIDPGKTKDLGDGVVEVIVSTGSIDRHNERIHIDGVDLKSYKKNPIVLYGHDYESLPIGKATSIKKNAEGQIVAKVQFAIQEYAFAKTVYDLIVGGYLNDVSIGGIVLQWNEDYTEILKLEMVEFSVVNIGANRDAKIISRSFGDKSIEDIADEYRDFVSKQIAERAKSMESNELEQTINSLEKLVAVLKASHSEAQNAQANADVKRVKVFTLKKAAQEVDKTAEKVIKLIKLKTPKE